MEYTSNTLNLRRLRRRGIYVDSTLKNVYQVDRYFSTSNPRRFNVEIYRAIGKEDFLRRIDVDSTSKSICEDLVYFKRRFNVEISLSTRTVDSSTSNIRRFHVEVSPQAKTTHSKKTVKTTHKKTQKKQ